MSRTTFEPYTPQFANPYPTFRCKIVGVEYTDDLHLVRSVSAVPGGEGRETEYILAKPYGANVTIEDQSGQQTTTRIEAPSGMLTDLTSVPRLFRSFLGRVGTHLEAAILHDFLFIAWQDLPGGQPQYRDFKFANRVFREAMKAAGVSFCSRWAAYLGVACPIGWFTYKGANPGTRYVAV